MTASELYILMRQGEQAWLLAGERGNHEYARLFWFDDGKGARYRVGQGGASRLGNGFECQHVAVDDKGATIKWSQGVTSFIPGSWFQLTWK